MAEKILIFAEQKNILGGIDHEYFKKRGGIEP
jgi:hypothetical protein